MRNGKTKWCYKCGGTKKMQSGGRQVSKEEAERLQTEGYNPIGNNRFVKKSAAQLLEAAYKTEDKGTAVQQEQYNQWLISQMQSGIPSDTLAAKGYGSLQQLNQLSQQFNIKQSNRASSDTIFYKDPTASSNSMNKGAAFSQATSIDPFMGEVKGMYTKGDTLFFPKEAYKNKATRDKIELAAKMLQLKFLIPSPGSFAAGSKAQTMKKGGPIVDPMGQWNHPGKQTIVPTEDGRITMQGVPYPVLGIDENGMQQMMYPNQEYQFGGTSVLEIPMMKKGGSWIPTKGIKSIRKHRSEENKLFQPGGINQGPNEVFINTPNPTILQSQYKSIFAPKVRESIGDDQYAGQRVMTESEEGKTVDNTNYNLVDLNAIPPIDFGYIGRMMSLGTDAMTEISGKIGRERDNQYNRDNISNPLSILPFDNLRSENVEQGYRMLKKGGMSKKYFDKKKSKK